MTLIDAQPQTTAPSWSRPAENLWIATLHGEYTGMVEFADGHFVATDSTGGPIDAFSAIPQAQAAVVGASAAGL